MIKISKTELTKKLEQEIWSATSKMGVFGCFEVTIGFNTTKYGRADYMTLDTKDIFRMYEIKVSKSDFHSKAKHTFKGHYNYYVMTENLYQEVKKEMPKEIGVYVLENDSYVVCKKNPKRQEMSPDDMQILKSSMIRSLYRDYEKAYKSKNTDFINSLNNRISQLEREKRKLQDENVEIRNRLCCMEMKYKVDAKDVEKEMFHNFKEGLDETSIS